jgi:hypothetical protein
MDTYANLKTEVVDWLNREGFTELEAKVDTFLGMAQRKIFRTCDFHCLEASTSGTGTVETIGLPDDFQRTKVLYVGVGGGLKEVTGGSYHNVITTQAGSRDLPRKYVRQGSVLVLGPIPDQEYTYYLMYYKSLPLLSDSNTTNWFTANAPELILFAALVEASVYLKDDNRAQVWQARYDQVKGEIQASEERSDKEYGGMSVQLA